MIRRFFILLVFVCGMTTSSFGQKKIISQAKELVKKGKDLTKAEQLMTNLLKDSANRGNEKIWTVLMDAVVKQYEQGNEKLYLKQKYDTASHFNTVKQMFEIAESIDSLDQKPDEKGKIHLKYREKNSELLNRCRPNLFNGGAYFVRKQKYKEAYNFFESYIDCAQQPMLSQYNYSETDSRMPEAAYWAVYCGYKQKDPKATLRHTYLALKDTAHYVYMLQYLAETYLIEQDTARYADVLKEGFKKYPKFMYFFPRLIEYHSARGELDEAMTIVDEALKADSTNEVFLATKSTLLLNTGKYDECIILSDTLIAHNDSMAVAWLNAGLSYFNKAVDIDKNTRLTKKQKRSVIDNYKKAMPYLQRYRQFAPDDSDRWSLPLYTIYLNLNMGKEFDEIDKLIRKNKR